MKWASVVALVVVGCGPEPSTAPLSVGDLEFFEARVEPHLEERCASGGCHGRPDRPLALYAPGMHRADPSRTWLDEPLSGLELEENARRAAAFGLEGAPEDTLLVQKPLSILAGGSWHGGGDVFDTSDDPACVALSAWLTTTRALDGGMR